jgi:hypothetical protein
MGATIIKPVKSKICMKIDYESCWKNYGALNKEKLV